MTGVSHPAMEGQILFPPELVSLFTVDKADKATLKHQVFRNRGAHDIEVEGSKITDAENASPKADQRRKLEKIKNNGENGSDKDHDPTAAADGIGESIEQIHIHAFVRLIAVPLAIRKYGPVGPVSSRRVLQP